MQIYSSIIAFSLFINNLSGEPTVIITHQPIPTKATLRVIPVDTIVQHAAQTVPPTSSNDSTVALIQHYDIIPAGWCRVDAFQTDTTPGPPTMWLIGRYEQLPVGSTFVMLSEDPVPPGWELASQTTSACSSQKTIVRRK